jgi:arsenate reductase
MKKNILFLCTHNSCRSQMAEGLVNHYLSDHFQAFSAGTEATRINPEKLTEYLSGGRE